MNRNREKLNRNMKLVDKRHAEGHSCYYGCTPARKTRCKTCNETDCSERITDLVKTSHSETKNINVEQGFWPGHTRIKISDERQSSKKKR